MKIAFFEPLGRGWNRMTSALFKPFDLNKWLVVAFTAFLAGLFDWNGGGGNGSSQWSRDGSFGEFIDFPGKAWSWLTSHPGWFTLILFGVAFLVILGIVLLWLSSRGKFMFLYNVALDKAEVSRPWKEYKKEGDSLFLWRFVFVLICFLVFLFLIVIMFAGGSQLYKDTSFHGFPILFFVMMGIIFLIVAVVVGYIALFLDSFVVPLMFKHRLSAMKGWGMFLNIFKTRPFHFILYGLLMLGLSLLFGIAVVIAGLLTCCVGFVLLVIPYIGTVITLPLWYWFRAFSLEFLAQFGDEYNVLPGEKKETTKT
ncbi:MAG: hypothetical protein GF421_10815 [Candidatus Aminicenantes bacterium]|nr:hypothetical protein [Candidatus Aminicenantes bacterium]